MATIKRIRNVFGHIGKQLEKRRVGSADGDCGVLVRQVDVAQAAAAAAVAATKMAMTVATMIMMMMKTTTTTTTTTMTMVIEASAADIAAVQSMAQAHRQGLLAVATTLWKR